MNMYRKKKNDSSCYACGKPATTREHVPPKVFFPEKKDMPSKYPDFRTDLLTVPSCDDHNLTKSLDDEYLFMIIVASHVVNEIALRHFKKVIRAIHHAPNKGKIYLKNVTPASVNGLLTIASDIDIERFYSSLGLIAKGIYYHNFSEQWLSHIEIMPLSLFKRPQSMQDMHTNEKIKELRGMVSQLFLKEKIEGSHPEIFFYQFHLDPDTKKNILRMVFYEGFEVVVSET